MQHTASVGYKTYKFKMTILENGKPEEFLKFLNNSKQAVDDMGTETVAGRISFLHTLLRVEIP